MTNLTVVQFVRSIGITFHAIVRLLLVVVRVRQCVSSKRAPRNAEDCRVSKTRQIRKIRIVPWRFFLFSRDDSDAPERCFPDYNTLSRCKRIRHDELKIFFFL